jgi:mono/diheme cytochrome c family protein
MQPCTSLRSSPALLLLTVLLIGTSPVLVAQDADNGEKLYINYGCYACHGYSAHGGRGPGLGPDAIPYEGFIRIVRSGRGGMPAYSAGVASDKDLADIHAFVRTVPASPAVKDIPLLKGGAGIQSR